MTSAALPHDVPPLTTLTVIGADDPLGEAVMREALVRGLAVRATAAHAELIPRLSPRLQVRSADPRNQQSLLRAVDGADAVVLGLTPQTAGAPTMRMTDTVIALVRAMREARTTRLVVPSSLDLGGHAAEGGAAGRARSLARSARRIGPRGGLRDLERLERLCEGSGMDWTVLRAGSLTDLLGTRRAHCVPLTVGGDAQLAREDLACALLDQALQPGHRPRVAAVTARDAGQSA
jgi:nucleoside-diphosphate-sugar epimerase